VRGQNDDWLELLLVAPSSPKIDEETVNTHLKISRGLDPRKRCRVTPLFEEAKGNIEVEAAPMGLYRIYETHSVFRGILDGRFVASLPDDFKEYYKVRVKATCLDKPDLPDSTMNHMGLKETIEYQDLFLLGVLEAMNGTALGGKNATKGQVKQQIADTVRDFFTERFSVETELTEDSPGARKASARPGMCCFKVENNAQVRLSAHDPDQPVRAYHPLFVHPANGLAHASLGHVADLHINARQHVLRTSDARVIEMDGGDARRDSPSIGSCVPIYSENFADILKGLASVDAGGEADVVLIGGDLVDHVQNLYDPTALNGLEQKQRAGCWTAGDVWKLVNLDDGYEQKYHSFVDHLSFYSIMVDFYASSGKPAFVVSGNHDAYQQAYGISPRVAKVMRANEGIAADHNLTFYEAMLAFGESYGTIRRGFNFEASLYQWFYSVLTPFSNFDVSLPNQRIVGLAWGSSEEMISGWPVGHGFGHLPRANQALSEEQLALVRKGYSPQRKTVLFSHFTFASYDDSIPNEPEKLPDKAKPGAPLAINGSVNPEGQFSKYDFGTFALLRNELYSDIVKTKNFQCILTGHSHRKGVYLLGDPDEGTKGFMAGVRRAYHKVSPTIATEMYSLAKPITRDHPALKSGKPPVVVSDSAGPLPRLNIRNELQEWGSAAPAGTLVQISGEGAVAGIKVVSTLRPSHGAPEPRAVTKPRLAVALDYLEVMKGHVHSLTGRVFSKIEVPLPDARGGWRIEFVFDGEFPRNSVQLASVVLYGLPSLGAPWMRIAMDKVTVDRIANKKATATLGGGDEKQGQFGNWLQMCGPGRFMSLRFEPRAVKDVITAQGAVLRDYNCDDSWNFEVYCYPVSPGQVVIVSYDIIPRAEKPNFDWRKQFPKYQP
jgi:3',5'-cyclic AMP phosphodiesterase CpdA